jgi:threonyl-tRNA synthetase
MLEIETIRHSLAHIMAYAVQELFPGGKFGIGPAVAEGKALISHPRSARVIENGFYYDLQFPPEKNLTP